MRLLADPVAYGRGVPHGDGRAVVVVPGFLASDDTLLLLRRWLRIVGYRPHTAGFRFSVDCAERAVERVEQLCEALHATTGRRVAIVGHSRGGHLARATAARRPRSGLARDLDGRRPAGPARHQHPDAGGGRGRAPRPAPHAAQPRPRLLPRAVPLRVRPRLRRAVPRRPRAPDLHLQQGRRRRALGARGRRGGRLRRGRRQPRRADGEPQGVPRDRRRRSRAPSST